MAAQNRSHARKQLAQAKRLDDVIVRAELEPHHAIDFIEAMSGDDDHWHIGIRPDVAEQIEPVILPHTQVQNHEARFCDSYLPLELLPIRGGRGAQTVLLQIPSDHAPRWGIVVDYQHICGIRVLINFHALSVATEPAAISLREGTERQ
jgi:hypothetical protein